MRFWCRSTGSIGLFFIHIKYPRPVISVRVSRCIWVRLNHTVDSSLLCVCVCGYTGLKTQSIIVSCEGAKRYSPAKKKNSPSSSHHTLIHTTLQCRTACSPSSFPLPADYHMHIAGPVPFTLSQNTALLSCMHRCEHCAALTKLGFGFRNRKFDDDYPLLSKSSEVFYLCSNLQHEDTFNATERPQKSSRTL